MKTMKKNDIKAIQEIKYCREQLHDSILSGLVGVPTYKELLMQENHRIIDLLNQAIQAEMRDLEAHNVYDMKDESRAFYKPIKSRISRMQDWIERSTHMDKLKIKHLKIQHHWNSTSNCKKCEDLKNKNLELKATIENLMKQADKETDNVCCTTVPRG
ncbi:hypothetical protein ACFE04_028943 [Oxalis oulophora]